MDNSVIDSFRLALQEKLGSHLKELWLFGSRARGDAHEYSDYDFLIIIDGDLCTLKDLIREEEWKLTETFGCLLASIVYPVETWKIAQNSPLGWNIKQEGFKVA